MFYAQNTHQISTYKGLKNYLMTAIHYSIGFEQVYNCF